MPYYADRTETAAGVSTAIVVAEVEQTCIGTTTIVAPALENRVVRIHKVRIISFIPIYNFPFLR